MSNTRKVLVMGPGSIGSAVVEVPGIMAQEVMANILRKNYNKLSESSMPDIFKNDVNFNFMSFNDDANILKVRGGRLERIGRNFQLPTDMGADQVPAFDCVLNCNVVKQSNGAEKTEKEKRPKKENFSIPNLFKFNRNFIKEHVRIKA